MRYIIDEEEKKIAKKYIKEAIIMTSKSTCERAKCGAVIVQNNEIIGMGFNSPPGDDESERRCQFDKDKYDKKVTDKTCCVHAEQRAVMDTLSHNPNKIKGAKLYFARYYSNGEQRLNGDNDGKNQLYCTICTKMMFDVGIIEFILPHINGIVVYSKNEYLSRSYDYGKYCCR